MNQAAIVDSTLSLSHHNHAASEISDALAPVDAHDGGFTTDLTFPSVDGNTSPTPGDIQFSNGSQLVALDTPPQGSTLPDLTNDIPSSNAEMCCPIDADAIRNRWLNAYLPVPGQKTKEYSPPITAFIYRILKAYAAIAIHGRGVPPFVHASQVKPGSISQLLATCLTLIRMCDKPLPGGEGAAIDVLQREMSSVYEQHDKYDDDDSLAAFQACLIYSMVLFFHLGQAQNPTIREAMMNLQHLACSTSRKGLMCISETQRKRPQWETWIVVEAKRRALYTMYLFDGVFSAQDGLPTALGTELTGLPAPSNKQLWQAQTRYEWEAAYNTYLADSMHGLRIDELWPVPDGLNDAGLVHRRSRVDRWLQEVDEYGTMLYAVTSCTHGG